MDINRSDWLPWSNPNFTPGAPHNLPSRPDPIVASSSAPPIPGDSFNTREPYRYASLITVSLTIGTSSVKFLDQPIGKRNFLGFRNASAGTQNLYVEFNGTASTGSWLKLVPGQLLVFDTVVPQDDLYVVSDAVGAVLSYAYSTFPG